MQNHGLVNRDTAAFWGENSRLDALHCAVGIVKLRHFEEIKDRFVQIAKRYRQGLGHLVGVPHDRKNEVSVYHNFVIDCDQRDQLSEFLAKMNIETKIHYPVLLNQQPAARKSDVSTDKFPNAERLVKRQLSLPIFAELTDDEVDYVIEKICDFHSI